jgi:hypothetical protein
MLERAGGAGAVARNRWVGLFCATHIRAKARIAMQRNSLFMCLATLLVCSIALAGPASKTAPRVPSPADNAVAAGGGKAAVVSCDHPALSLCDEASDPKKAKDLESFCKGGNGTFVAKACSATGLVGTCASSGAVKKFYSTGESPFTAATAKDYCTENMAGKFTPAK